MFLSQLTLDRSDRQALKVLSDIYRLHQAVLAGFTSYQSLPRVLFRVEPETNGPEVRVLVQSEISPDWQNRLPGLIGAKIKHFTPNVDPGRIFRFRVRVNPIVTRDGKRRGLVRDESLIEWFMRKEEKIGAHISSVTAIDEGYLTGYKGGGDARRHHVRIKAARMEGRLEVINPEVFSQTLRSGIGPAKAFGCGLLSLARA